MPQFDKIVQGAAENLYGDERLRSNLTDGEAKVVLDWAAKWLGEQVSAARDEPTARQIAQNEHARVRQTATARNTLAKKPGALRLADAVAALDVGVQTAKPCRASRSSRWRPPMAGALDEYRQDNDNGSKGLK